MRHASLDRARVSPSSLSQVQHTAHASPRPRSRPDTVRTVRIDDTDTIAALLHAGIPHQVVCELPAQLNYLGTYGEGIAHLKLELTAPPDAPSAGGDSTREVDEINEVNPREEWDAAVNEALLRCAHLSSLALCFLGKATPDLFDDLASKMAHSLKSPASLELSFRGAPSITVGAGVKELLSRHPDMSLRCRGGLACSMVLLALTRSAQRSRPNLRQLALSGTDPLDRHVIFCLACLPVGAPGIAIQCDDASQCELLIDALLAEGVSNELQLVAHTPDGHSVDLQERLDAVRQAHLERLLQTCTHEGRLDLDELLARCQSIQPAGPQLFAWACQVAVSDAAGERPEVPMVLHSCLRAVRHAGVAHTVRLRLPADLQTMMVDDLSRIVGLRLELGTMDVAGWRMLANALNRMTNLKSGSFHQLPNTAYDLGRWLCPRLESTGIEVVHFDLAGGEAAAGSDAVGSFLSKSGLKSVSCEGPRAASLILKSAARLYVQPGITITVYLSSQDASHVPRWLKGIKADRGESFKVDIHVLASQPPEAFMTELDHDMRTAQPGFCIPHLSVSAASYRMPPSSRLGLSLIRQQILLSMKEVDKQLRRQPQGVDGTAVSGAFGASIGNGFDPAGGLSPEQLRIVATANGLGEAMKHLRHFLAPSELMGLSSVNTRARQHIGNLAIRQHDGAMHWFQQVMGQGFSPHDAQAVLQPLLGTKVAQEVTTSFLELLMRRLAQAVMKGDQKAAFKAGTADDY